MVKILEKIGSFNAVKLSVFSQIAKVAKTN